MIRIRQIRIPLEDDNELTLKKYISKKLLVSEKKIKTFSIVKKSLDARKKPFLYSIYEVDCLVEDEESILKKMIPDVFRAPLEEYSFPKSGFKKMKNRPVIVGSGPAGLFCAYELAMHGYKPIIIERGERIEDRVKTVEEFFNSLVLNVNSNVQFGEGGAGTFSDGKLNTMVKDKFFRGKRVFEIFIENGAPKEIMYMAHPHIGTDLLQNVIINIREKIISMGGKFHYNTLLTDLRIEKNEISAIEVNHEKWIFCECLVLALGHSARDTFEMLFEKGMDIESKPFAVGVRVEHPQKMINDSQYGKKYSLVLPPANYKLTYTTKNKRGVYSFCMCPGGYVINASSEPNRLAINGMSTHMRDTDNANAAIVVTVTKDDFGPGPLAGLEFQRKLEEKAFLCGKGCIPVQLYRDFKENKVSTAFESIKPITKGKTVFADLNTIFPTYITDSIKEAMEYFDTKIHGFSSFDTLLFAVESRTSSPIKIKRSEECVSNILGIYPCGEGAGYAGGITSAAMDGIKISEEIAKIYAPFIDKNQENF